MVDVARRLYRSPPPRRESDAAPASAAASSGDLGEGSLEASRTSWRDENSKDRSVPSSILYAFTAVAGFDHDRQPVDANLLRCRFRDRVYDFVTSGGIAFLNEFEEPTSRKPGGMLLGPAHAGVVPKRPGEVQNVGDAWADAGNWTYALVVRGVHIVDQLLRQQGLEPPASELHWRIQTYGEGRKGIESLGDVVESVLAVGGSTDTKPGAVRIVPKPADEDEPPQKKKRGTARPTGCKDWSLNKFRAQQSLLLAIGAAQDLGVIWQDTDPKTSREYAQQQLDNFMPPPPVVRENRVRHKGDWPTSLSEWLRQQAGKNHELSSEQFLRKHLERITRPPRGHAPDVNAELLIPESGIWRKPCPLEIPEELD